MNNRSRPTLGKRNREQQRRERAQAKAERRDKRAAERRTRADVVEGEDPDIAGIVPGPQPPRDD